MSRRKRGLFPEKMDHEKRHRLSWDMTDCIQNGGNTNITCLGVDVKPKPKEKRQAEVGNNTAPDSMTFDHILCELKLDHVDSVKSSFGKLGSFSGAFLNLRYLEQVQLTLNHGEITAGYSGIIAKLCNTDQEIDEIVSKCIFPYESRQCLIGDDNYCRYIQVNATIEQVNALKYLQTKGLVNVILSKHFKGKATSSEGIELLIYLNQRAFSKVTLPSEDPCLKLTDKMMKILIECLYDIHSTTTESPKHSDIYDDNLELLFNGLKKMTEHYAINTFCSENSADDNKTNMSSRKVTMPIVNKNLEILQHASLVPSLRRYQMKSVNWMINRETIKGKLVNRENCDLHPLWKEISIDHTSVWYNVFTGRIFQEKLYHMGYPSGGILADEMGLGKTVEVLACILNHPMNGKLENTALSKQETISEKCSLQPGSFTAQSQENSDCLKINMKCMVNKEQNCTSNESSKLVSITNDIIAHTSMELESVSCKQQLDPFLHQTINADNIVEMIKDEKSIRCICGKNTAVDGSQEELLKCSLCDYIQHSACIGMHVKHCHDEIYICPHCVVKKPVIESRATLIISPVTIAHQWLDEIHRHVLPGSLDVLVYEGVSKQGFIYPSVLADNDVILTTYEALKKDFYHLATCKAGENRSSRHRKRYASWPSPLTCIKYWRICLDEAQMVESTTAKAAETALNLIAVHRWCVTGTPIQRGVEDLYGLLLFLGVEPYYRKTWWKKLLYEPFLNGNSKPLLDVLYNIMWRTSKKDVIDEINLPEQQETVQWLHFSPVEEHFYRRQHEECSSSALKEINKVHESMTKLNSLDKHSVQKVMGPLLRLRQACCHPQAVRGCFLSFQKSTITMEQLLETLITKAKKESEEAHRLLLCAMNGLAGTYILQENWAQAVDSYREAMGSWKNHEELIKTDSLQKLHTLHNLHEVLKQGFPGCSRTLRDDFLPKEAIELCEHYMEKWKDQVAIAETDVTSAHKILDELKEKVDLKCPWWAVYLEQILAPEDKNTAERKLPEKLIEKVKDDLLSMSKTGESLNMADSFMDLRGLEFLLVSKLNAIERTHESLVVELTKLCGTPSKDTITSVAECCLRPLVTGTKSERCKFCTVDDIFSLYESLLFGHQGVNNIDQESQQIAGGLRGETEVERALKSIYNFMRTQNKYDEKFIHLQQQAQSHFEYLDITKKNFKVYRHLWFALREQISALDELEMCTMRLRLRFPGEKIEENQIHVINPVEVEATQMKFRADKIVANSDLRKSLGQLLYLKNLAKTQVKDGGENVEPCPVCTKPLGVQWNVFLCGHCLCCQCLWILLNQAGTAGRPEAKIKCPMCRATTMTQDITYVSTAAKVNEDEKHIVVKGSHSTKVEAIVRTLLRIQTSDPGAKTLVFSTWQDVLEHISCALNDNNIKYRRIKGRKDFQESLEEFKEDSRIPVLLLPLQSGSNGLNIIEATHVILVEPSLNPSLEKQAVGRIHRIGQTKQTFIHRLLVRNTVEEKITSFLQTKTVSGFRCGTRRTDKDAIPLTIGELASFFELPTEAP